MHELELNDAAAVGNLIELCTKDILDPETRSNTIDLIIEAKKTQKKVVFLNTLDLDGSHETIPLAKLPKLLAKLAVGDGEISQIDERAGASSSGRGRGKTLETSPVRQELPESIVSAVKIRNKMYNNLHA